MKVGNYHIVSTVQVIRIADSTYLDAVTNEEDGCVIANHIPVTFFCVELHAEASRIAGRVCGALLTTDCGEANCNICLLANFTEEICRGLIDTLVIGLELGGRERQNSLYR